MADSKEVFMKIKPPKLQKISQKLYCHFGSKKARDQFMREHYSFRRKETFRGTNDTIPKHSQNEILILKDSPLEKSKKISAETKQSIKKCYKCNKLLLPTQFEDEACTECLKIQQLIRKGTFEKFVRFIYEYKVGRTTSYSSTGKLRRIESIQSCLSIDVADGGESSSVSQKNKNSGRLSFSGKNTKMLKSNSLNKKAQNSSSNPKESVICVDSAISGGYYCNECSKEPIVGRRFHCLVCSDYDLCQRCYFCVGHKHQMKAYRDSKEGALKKVKENTLKQTQMLEKTLPLLTRSIQQFEKLKGLSHTSQFKKDKKKKS